MFALEGDDTQADADRHGVVVPTERQGHDPFADALGHIERAERVGVGQEKNERPAREAGQHIGLPQRFAAGFGDALQQGVTAAVAEAVVDPFEMIGVNQHQRAIGVVAPRQRPFALDHIEKMAAVEDAGQRVERGVTRHRAVQLIEMGDQAQKQIAQRTANAQSAGRGTNAGDDPVALAKDRNHQLRRRDGEQQAAHGQQRQRLAPAQAANPIVNGQQPARWVCVLMHM